MEPRGIELGSNNSARQALKLCVSFMTWLGQHAECASQTRLSESKRQASEDVDQCMTNPKKHMQTQETVAYGSKPFPKHEQHRLHRES